MEFVYDSENDSMALEGMNTQVESHETDVESEIIIIQNDKDVLTNATPRTNIAQRNANLLATPTSSTQSNRKDSTLRNNATLSKHTLDLDREIAETCKAIKQRRGGDETVFGELLVAKELSAITDMERRKQMKRKIMQYIL